MKLMAALFLCFAAFNAQAFTLNNSAKLVFAQDEVTVNVAGGFCTNIGITDTEFLTIVGEAVDQFWNKAPTSRLKLRQGQIINVATAFHTDTICTASTNCTPNPTIAVTSDILVSCNNNSANFTSSSILGVTIPNNISGTTILGSLVMINDMASTQFDTKTHAEKVAIISHELGHAFGLGHSPVEDSLMYYATVSQRTRLGRDDIDGISYLYPKQQPISGCGTIDLNKSGPNFWPGLFIGVSIIALAELFRKKSKASTAI
ncbi:MAG: matrixin family metalloprotease [Bacteriovorax sp.]|nr:matrixin family metalloprotease [Bacteriovorax sp.]